MTNNPVPQWTQASGSRANHARSKYYRHEFVSRALRTKHRHGEQVGVQERRTAAGDPTAIGHDYRRSNTCKEVSQKERRRGTSTEQVVETHSKADNCSWRPGTDGNSRDKGGPNWDLGGGKWDMSEWGWGMGGKCWGKGGWGWGMGWGMGGKCCGKGGWGWGIG
jgi:hypothetical protein